MRIFTFILAYLLITSTRATCQTVTDSGLKQQQITVTDTILYLEDVSTLLPDKTYILGKTVFIIDRHKMKNSSYSELQRLTSLLAAAPELKIHIEGHVCCIKDAPDALDIDTNEPQLSVNRAMEVYNYLKEKGIGAGRMTYSGMGHRRPIIANEKTENDAATNRRVEIRVMK